MHAPEQPVPQPKKRREGTKGESRWTFLQNLSAAVPDEDLSKIPRGGSSNTDGHRSEQKATTKAMWAARPPC